MTFTTIRAVLMAITLTGIARTGLQAQTSGPGGIAGNIGLWLDASAVTATNNTVVTTWPDRSGNNNNFTSAVGATFNTGAQNGKPVFLFNGTSQYFERDYTAALNPANVTLFAVTRVETSALYKSVITSRNDNGGYMVYSLPNPNTWEFWYGIGSGGHNYEALSSGIQTTAAWSIMTYTATNANLAIYRNNAAVATGNATYGANTSRPTRIGAGNTDVDAVDFYFRGSIAELAVYGEVVSAAKRMIITNSLAWKYNIALTANYSVTGASATYSNDPGGIGRLSAADQVTDSRAGLVRMFGTTTSLTDNEYLFWGHNGGALVATATDLPAAFNATIGGVTGSYKVGGRLGRAWKVYERNGTGGTGIDVGTVSLSVDLTNVPGTKRLVDLVLIVDRDNDGTFADETYIAASTSSGIFTAATLAANVVTFTGVNLKENDNFTVGTLNIIQTPLPVKLVYLSATVTAERQVRVQWQTAMEQNSSHFIIERSAEGSDWVSIDTVRAAGTSHALLMYSRLDLDAPGGHVYYRIKSVDLDETFAYSGIATVTLPVVFTIYPNPARVEVFIETEYASQPLLLGDSQGLFREVRAEQVGDNKLRIDISTLKAGVYILRAGNRWNRIVVL